MSSKIKRPSTGPVETWWYVDQRSETLNQRRTDLHGYPEPQFLGKTMFMSFPAAKQALMDHFERKIKEHETAIGALKNRSKVVRAFKESHYESLLPKSEQPPVADDNKTD